MKHNILSLALGMGLLFVGLFAPQKALADIDPKVKAMATMAAYGTVGGALLGTASLAFGTDGRSVAVGSSLGLYAGLLFGTYVIVSHSLQQRGYYDRQEPVQRDYYPDDSYSPYNRDTGGGGTYDGGFNRVQIFKEREMTSLHERQGLDRMGGIDRDRPTFEVNLLNLQF